MSYSVLLTSCPDQYYPLWGDHVVVLQWRVTYNSSFCSRQMPQSIATQFHASLHNPSMTIDRLSPKTIQVDMLCWTVSFCLPFLNESMCYFLRHYVAPHLLFLHHVICYLFLQVDSEKWIYINGEARWCYHQIYNYSTLKFVLGTSYYWTTPKFYLQNRFCSPVFAVL